MHLRDIFDKHWPSVSFEFFPPKSDEAAEQLFNNVKHLERLRPSFVTVTFGAGGSTRALTEKVVYRLNRETGVTTLPHLTSVNATRDDIHQILANYQERGIENVVALRGDPPKGMTTHEPPPDGFRYATELVRYVREHFPNMGIAVAGYPEGHPETPDRLTEMRYLKEKVDAGADCIITQLFFDNRDYWDFVQRCEIEGIKVPIIAGIMPVQSLSGLKRMTAMCGARIPAPMLRMMSRVQDDKEGVRMAGVHWATEQVRDLFDQNVRGIHLYTLNTSDATRRIYESLGIRHSGALRI